MKKYSVIMATLFASSLFLTACGGSGANTRSMNANRGAPSAHVNAAQAEQYARQQRLEGREVKLENMKRRQTTDAVKEGAGAVGSVVDVMHGL